MLCCCFLVLQSHREPCTALRQRHALRSLALGSLPPPSDLAVMVSQAASLRALVTLAIQDSLRMLSPLCMGR